jgi:lipopolysaccharide export system permease protein
MLKYFDDIIGKGLGWTVVGQLFFYFGIYTTPTAMPLAVLLSSLIAYGNLGEHFELTAVKSAGISLVRTLLPIFIFVLGLTGFAFYINNNLVPKAALEAYSLLYDIRQKKPALDLREGTFYNGIPSVSIKVDKKFPDGETLKDVIIYDHRKNDGNRDVTAADSGRMYTVLNERYLKFELFNGYNYSEGQSAADDIGSSTRSTSKETISRTRFNKSQLVYDLSSFELERTDKKWFESNRIMRNISQLDTDIDSIKREIMEQRLIYYLNQPNQFSYYTHKDSLVMPREIYQYRVRRDSLSKIRYEKEHRLTSPKKESSAFSKRNHYPSNARGESFFVKTALNARQQTVKKALSDTVKIVLTDSLKHRADSIALVKAKIKKEKFDSLFSVKPSFDVIQSAANSARQFKSQIENGSLGIENYSKELMTFEIQWHRIITNSLACIAMFLIGAPLGAIIKRGGLGIPFLVSIFFFIVFYLLTMQGEKLAKQGTVNVIEGIWAADFILLMIGLFFLRQARNDARLFEADFYLVVMDKAKRLIRAKKTAKITE